MFEHTVEQVFHRPGQFTEDQRADHAPAAFQGVEGAAQFGQRITILRIGRPARQVFVENFEDLVGLFEEHLAQLIVDRFFIGRRRHQAAGGDQRWRVERRNRAGQNSGQRLHGFRVIERLHVLHHQRFAGAEHVFEHGHMRLIWNETQTRKGLLRDIQQLLARRLRIVAQTFEVILEAADDIGQMIQLFPTRFVRIKQQMFADKPVARLDQTCRAVQRNHRQRTAHLSQQRRQRLQVLAIPIGVDVVDDHVLGLLQADACFLDHDLMDLRQVGGRQARIFRAFRLDGADHPGQRRFDVKQRTGNVHEDRVIRFALALGEAEHDS
ncbi:hypothetical protein D3C87_918880 [compost metagenome]